MIYRSILFLILILIGGSRIYCQTDNLQDFAKNIKVGGLLQLWQSQEELNPLSGSFFMRRMELKVSGDIVKDKIGFVAMIDPISKSFVVNEAGNDNHVINVAQDLFFTFKFSDKINLKVGQFLYPLTREGLAPTEFLHLIERSRLGSIIGDKRDIGIQFFGLFPYFNYSVAIINGNGQDLKDNNEKKDLVARLIFTPIKGLEIGGSGYVGKETINGLEQNKERFCVEFEFSNGKWGVIGEYGTLLNGTQRSEGYYGLAYYEIIPNLETAFRYESWDQDKNNNSDDLSSISLGAGYYLYNKHLKINLDYTHTSFNDDNSTNEFITGVQIIF